MSCNNVIANHVAAEAAAASSRQRLQQLVSNGSVDEQGDHRDHVTERWRHHRPVAPVRMTETLVVRMAPIDGFLTAILPLGGRDTLTQNDLRI